MEKMRTFKVANTPEEHQLIASLWRNATIYALLNEQTNIIQDTLTSIKPLMIKEIERQNPNNIGDAHIYGEELSTWMKTSVSDGNILHTIRGMILCQNVQAFDYFMTQLLTKTFMQCKHILNAKEFSIQMDEVLQCSNIEEIVSRVVARKIHNLGYDSFEKIIGEYFNKKLGLDFDTSLPEYLETCEMFLARNLIVHNNSYVNEIYLQRTKRTDLQLGDLYPLTDQTVTDSIGTLMNLGLALGTQFVSHFNLHN